MVTVIFLRKDAKKGTLITLIKQILTDLSVRNTDYTD